MKLGIILIGIGLIAIFYFANLKFKKRVLKKAGIFIGIIIFLYGLIQLVQPDDYIKFTKTTISTKTETPIEKK
ncbi:MAG: hypothetical protein HN901_05605 [Campylobacteraceae bacterium]|jgi:hypothetical protein|nr:hypothetical protein [Campylobacteraceae bacterium]